MSSPHGPGKPKPPYMNDTTTKTKRKSPVARYHHVRFFQLRIGEDFYIGDSRYTKTHFLTKVGGKFIGPWKKVRSTRPVKPVQLAIAKAYDKLLRFEPWPENMGQTIERGPAYRGIMGCQGDRDAHDAVIGAAHAAKLTCGLRSDVSGDRTSESTGGNELTPSA